MIDRRKVVAVAVALVSVGVLVAGLFWALPRESRVAGPSSPDASRGGVAIPRTVEVEKRRAALARSRAERVAAPAVASERASPMLEALGDVAHRYWQLAARAERGDVAAAAELARGLRACHDAPTTDAEITARSGAVLLQKEPAPDARQQMETLLRKKRERCSVVPVNARDAYWKWLSAAAAGGDAEARLSYAMNGAPDQLTAGADYYEQLAAYRERAEEYVAAELASGNAEALRAYAGLYARGVVFPRDQRSEYAYVYAYSLAQPDATPAVFNWLAMLRSSLGTEATNEAISRGEQIYRECCAQRG